MKTILIIWTLFIASQHDALPITKVPELHVNFYLMGKTVVDPILSDKIEGNIAYLNQEFEGRIYFKKGDIYTSEQHAYIPDIHKEYIENTTSAYMDMVASVENSGNINVFLFETYVREDGTAAMTGFTPVLRSHHHTYKLNTPLFDRLYIAYPGLEDKSTLVHEMGHFLGLSHPWEMHSLDKELMGLTSDRAETNHMTYHHQVDHFTTEQLDRMQHFALVFRSYLIKDIAVSY